MEQEQELHNHTYNSTDNSTDNSTPDSVPHFADKVIVCCDCSREFVWEKGEQEYFWSKGLADPKRCLDCRRRRKITIMGGARGG